MKLFLEIAYASRLLKQDKAARDRLEFDGRISSKAKKDIKTFLAWTKQAFQKLNTCTGLYIKSFFFDVERGLLVLYTRQNGNDTKWEISPAGKDKYTFNGKGVINGNMRRHIIGMLEYYIPSENSLTNHTAINLMPSWRMEKLATRSTVCYNNKALY